MSRIFIKMSEAFGFLKGNRDPQHVLIDGLLLDLWRALFFVWVLILNAVPFLLRRLVGIHEDPGVIGARFRLSLESLGITYIKLGQFLAMRFDILPEEVCRELAQLFDGVPPLATDVVRGILETELSMLVEEAFRDFEWTCIAAASVAQVHRATKLDGKVVAIKVQRPGITRIFAADIRNLRRAAHIGDRLHVLGLQSMVEAVDEFERYTKREMDFTIEARTADRLRSNAGPFEDAPRIHWDLTTSRVLTMDFVDGYPLSKIIDLVESGRTAALESLAPGLNLHRAVQNLARACLRQLFVTGFFHGDPHPGNIFLHADGTVVFVDFGIFGQLTTARRETFASYIENVAVGNVEQSYRHFIRLLQPTAQTDMRRLKRDVHRIMHRWHDASQRVDGLLSERHLGTYFSEFITAIRDNNVKMSMDTLLFWRALLALDATVLRFESQFNLLTALREFFEQTRPTVIERLDSLVTDRALAGRLLDFGHDAPGQVTRLEDDLTRGQSDLRVRVDSGTIAARSRSVHVHLLALTIVNSSLAILAVKASLTAIGEAVTWTAVVSLMAVILVEWIHNPWKEQGSPGSRKGRGPDLSA
jgi:ubiquinone biosynthesis protein